MGSAIFSTLPVCRKSTPLLCRDARKAYAVSIQTKEGIMKYQWAIKVTTEYLNPGAGGVESTATEIRPAGTEQEARRRHEAILDTLTSLARGGQHPKYQRLGGSELIRRPLGEWETVEKSPGSWRVG
jgi:hypothetical protein